MTIENLKKHTTVLVTLALPLFDIIGCDLKFTALAKNLKLGGTSTSWAGVTGFCSSLAALDTADFGCARRRRNMTFLRLRLFFSCKGGRKGLRVAL